MEKETFREISKKCVEALNEYFDICFDEIKDRHDLNDKIMKIGEDFGITLFDLTWLLNMPASIRTSPKLTFAISLPLTSTGAANYNFGYMLIKVYNRSGNYVARIEIDEDGVDISGPDTVIEEIQKL